MVVVSLMVLVGTGGVTTTEGVEVTFTVACEVTVKAYVLVGTGFSEDRPYKVAQSR
jgi:hypothetical protein